MKQKSIFKILIPVLVLFSCKKDKTTVPPEENKLNMEKVEKRMDFILNELKVPGMAVALTDQDKVIWHREGGFARLQEKVKVNEKTIFKLASIAKPMIALSAMRLVDEGRLDLDKNINDYLPFEIVNPHCATYKITMRHLLSHTSGITDRIYENTFDFMTSGADHPLDLAGFVSSFIHKNGKYYNTGTFSDAEPGTVYSYTNTGASLAAYVIECIAKTSFDQFSSKLLFNALGKESLYWHLRDFPTERLAYGHYLDYTQTGIFSIADYASGGLHGTATDLARFSQLLLNNGRMTGTQVISGKSLDEMKKIPFPLANARHGLFLESIPLSSGARLYGYNGNMIGYGSYMYVVPEKKRGVVILFNYQSAEDNLQSEKIRAELNKLLGDLLDV